MRLFKKVEHPMISLCTSLRQCALFLVLLTLLVFQSAHAGLIHQEYCWDVAPGNIHPQLQGIFISNKIPQMGTVHAEVHTHESRGRGGNVHAPSNLIIATNRLDYVSAYLIPSGHPSFSGRLELPLFRHGRYSNTDAAEFARYWQLDHQGRPIFIPDLHHSLRVLVDIEFPGMASADIRLRARHAWSHSGWLQLFLRADGALPLSPAFTPPTLPPFNSEWHGAPLEITPERLRAAIERAILSKVDVVNLLNRRGIFDSQIHKWVNSKAPIPPRHMGPLSAFVDWAEGLSVIEQVTAAELDRAVRATDHYNSRIARLLGIHKTTFACHRKGAYSIPPDLQRPYRAFVDWVNDTYMLGPLRGGVMVPRGGDQLPVPVPTRVEVNPLPGSSLPGRVALTAPVTSADPRRVELGSASQVTQPGRVEVEMNARRGVEVDPARGAADFARRRK